MGRRRPRLRAAALVTVAALTLHELRYALAGAEGGETHAYLPLAHALSGVLLGLALGELVARVAEARAEAARGARPAGGFARLWAMAGAAVLTVHAGQEGVEALVAPGAVAAGPASLVVALVLAAGLGAVVALLLRGADAVLAAARRRDLRARQPVAPVLVPGALPFRPRGSVLARKIAGRAPPIAA